MPSLEINRPQVIEFNFTIPSGTFIDPSIVFSCYKITVPEAQCTVVNVEVSAGVNLVVTGLNYNYPSDFSTNQPNNGKASFSKVDSSGKHPVLWIMHALLNNRTADTQTMQICIDVVATIGSGTAGPRPGCTTPNITQKLMSNDRISQLVSGIICSGPNAALPSANKLLARVTVNMADFLGSANGTVVPFRAKYKFGTYQANVLRDLSVKRTGLENRVFTMTTKITLARMFSKFVLFKFC
ncbi:hypothetical protein PHET_04221 [Paragonimus heterotremus]|uniref:Uncharacterized protein n=1 Tax=Paragonimus heterotremus TaxID=100268 RepID=A0A8J4TCS8_9TREM|nr:hypothetical protein PHET_04221 [Paragonimus heterotremus]